MNQDEQDKKTRQLIAKCWTDDSFRKKLLSSPDATLKAEGVEISPGVEVRAVENTDKVFYLVVPAKLVNAELSEEELEAVAGGRSVFLPPPAGPIAGRTR